MSAASPLSRLLARAPRAAIHPRASLAPRARTFTSTPTRPAYKTVEQAKSRYRSGPFSWKAGTLFILSGVGLGFYFKTEKERMMRKRIAENSKGVGRPKVGGPLDRMVDQNGKEVSEEMFVGKYRLMYFGFTHCPDICPEELDKMAEMIDLVKKKCGNVMVPVFVTCDPVRDTPPVMKEYLEEFHKDMMGLTGTYERIKQLCKDYRVYFSTPEDIKPGQDYLVDHSIYFYLMDPEGDFVEALGRQHTSEQAADVINAHIKDWTGTLRKD